MFIGRQARSLAKYEFLDHLAMSRTWRRCTALPACRRVSCGLNVQRWGQAKQLEPPRSRCRAELDVCNRCRGRTGSVKKVEEIISAGSSGKCPVVDLWKKAGTIIRSVERACRCCAASQRHSPPYALPLPRVSSHGIALVVVVARDSTLHTGCKSGSTTSFPH